MRALVPLLVLVVLASTATAHSYVAVRYVAGSGGGPAGEGVCAQTLHPEIDIGGGCRMQVHSGRITITLSDDLRGAVPFTWTAANAAGERCLHGSGAGTAVTVLPAECVYLSVFPPYDATTGKIHVAFG